MKKAYTTPNGTLYSVYNDMLKQPHLLIAGATGSGKSVVVNALVYTAILNSPARNQFILIDPKRVELIDFKELPHTIIYASEPGTMVKALNEAMDVTENRYKSMQRNHTKFFEGSNVYVMIDELADLMTTNKRQVMPLLQRLCQIGRAARIHVIACTQCPISKVIPTEIKVNFDSRVALRTRSKQDSRNILGVSGCEQLPRFGKGYYMNPEQFTLYNLPMVDQTEMERVIAYWKRHSKPKLSTFAPA